MRGFRCVPVSLKYSPVLARLSSFELSFFLMSHLAQDDRHCLPYDAAILRSEVFPGRPFVALSEIANARARLVALGVYTHKRGAKKEWLEIAEEYRHVAGQNETSFGEYDAPAEDSEEQAPMSAGEQKELMLGVVGVVPARKSRKSRKSAATPAPQIDHAARLDTVETGGNVEDTAAEVAAAVNKLQLIHKENALGSKINGLRVEEKKEKDTESAREASAAPAALSPLNQDLHLQAVRPPTAAGSAPAIAANVVEAKFRRGADDCDDSLWRELCAALGRVEMTRCGALWLSRFKLCRDALSAALSDWKALRPETRKHWTAARYLTTAFQTEKMHYA